MRVKRREFSFKAMVGERMEEKEGSAWRERICEL